MADRLVVRGAREHNLKDVSLDLPRDAMIVFTGLSGSGKSSLAFDTIFAEGQRRYVESLSAYARQFLGQMDKPDVDFIDGLSPAVSIDQKAASRNPRSTVGTITEVYDYLRLLYARVGKPHCPLCGRPIARQSPQQIVDRVLELEEGTRFQVLAPVVRGRKGEYGELLRELQTKGFSRARVDGTVVRLEDAAGGSLPALKKYEKHDIEVIVDRLAVKDTARRRLTDSVETALSLSGGVVVLDFVDLAENDPHRERMYSEHLACLYDDLSFDELEPRSFSFNSPWGACPDCTGLGTRMEVDPELVVPDPGKSLSEGAIAPWSGGHVSDYFDRLIEALGETVGFRMDTPWEKLPARARDALLKGHDGQVHVRYRNRYGRERSYYTNFEGAIPYIERRYAEAESDSSREKFAGFMGEVPCPSCGGARLKPVSLAVTVDGRSIAEFSALPIGELAKLLLTLDLSERDMQIARLILKEVNARLGFLLDVGLDYLTLDRASATLAGGEAQRIRLATQIGSGLVGVLYVLDEPSIGLHQRDNHRLLETLLRLRDLGNTLIVVEHDEDTIRAADWVVDIGPGAGEHGGKVVVSGPVGELLASPESLTGAYLSGRASIPVPATRRKPARGREVAVKGATEHNLREIDVAFPLGCLVAVTGVSGSGKSTLVNDILYRALAKELHGARTVPGRHARITGVKHLDKVVHVDQGPIGRTPRSNPATYTGVFDHIRRLFAQTTEAKIRGYQPGRFSFNVKGGRCEACSGDGTIKIEMQFLPDVYVPCEVCHGARYNTDTLQVHYKGKNISEVLDMPIEEAADFFAAVPAIARHMKTLVEVGLGYVRLGQPATTLSGGEAQRVKLSAELSRRATGRTMYLLDEPTTGLHFADVEHL
ncbi:MAG: excinuclease ABC subunit UvrA, partial [Streptosporangiaceae bacterium]|nr:excinuclease ABC subunit UvrA [Streptosporangiaceae bacterium]